MEFCFKWILLLMLLACIAVAIDAQASPTIQVRIAPGSGDSKTYGRLEVSQDGTNWGTVCDTDWDDNEARAVCQQLGYLWGRGYRKSKYGQGTGAIYLDKVNCKGNEKSLSSCTHGSWGTHQCGHAAEAGVKCDHTTVFVPSAVDGIYGPVLVWRKNQWMPICDKGWNNKQANVVCKQLGYSTGNAFCCSTFSHWQQQSAVTYSNFLQIKDCPATATKIEDCNVTETTTACGFHHQASVMCLSKKDDTAPEVRLTDANGQPSIKSGRLEVKYKGKWGTVCTKTPKDEIAQIACTKLGYPGGWVMGRRPSRPNLLIWAGNVTCSGLESSLLKCNSTGLGYFGYCDHSDDVHVLCYEDAYADVECLMSFHGTDYSGKKNTTASGYTCQRWDSQTPHRHRSNNTMLFPENDLANAENYCRNPSGSHVGPWCYTTRTDVEWEKCDIRHCESHQCRHTTKGIFYDGKINRTTPGNYTCQRWDSNKPHRNSMIGMTTFPEGNSTLAENFCRNPDSDTRGPWCYTTSSSPTYEYCNIPYCNYNKKCKRTPMGREYTGTIAKSRLGYKCLFWSEFKSRVGLSDRLFPDLSVEDAKNYCRNPSNRIMAFCIVFDSGGRVYIDYCTIPPCDDVKVRLMGGQEFSHGGRVEVQFAGQWGTICDPNWDDKDARVICRQLGYVDGVASRTSYKDKGTGPVWFTGMNCTGNETSIEKCPSFGRWNVTDSTCTDHSRDAGVLCSIGAKLLYGLTRPTRAIGMLVLYTNGSWAKQCGSTWDDNASKVVCRQLGYKYHKTLCCATFGRSLYNVAFAYPKCTGNETNIHQCKFIEQNCQAHETNYISLGCSNTPPKALEIELYGGPTNYTGHVVGLHSSGSVGYICKTGWDDRDANVACRSLGYKGGVATTIRNSGSLDIIASYFRCKGNESHITDCPYTNTTSCMSPWSFSRYAGALCYNKTGVAYRLVETKKDSGEGRVEIQYDGVWGTVCDSLWSNYDANVFCRQLNYTGGTAIKGSKYGRGTGPVHVTGFSCANTEATLLQCINNGWTNVYTSCKNHTRDAGVICSNSVKLLMGVYGKGSTRAALGGVLITRYGTWGRVCSEGFDDKDAQVVCRGLNYANGVSVGTGIVGKTTVTRALISNATCLGSEMDILKCSFSTYIPYSCQYTYTNYASVLCFDGTVTKPEFTLGSRVVNVTHQRVVYLEAYTIRARICRTSWNDAAGHVACKEAGFAGGVAMNLYMRLDGPMLTPKVNCKSTNNKIGDCIAGYTSGGYCKYPYQQSGILCYSQSPGIQFRATGGRTKANGRAEIGYEGKWGMVCTRGMGTRPYHSSLTRVAKVHCRSMGFEAGGEVSVKPVPAAASGTPYYLNLVACDGDEENLLQCRHYGWKSGLTDCSQNSILKVSCFTDMRIGKDNSLTYGPAYVKSLAGSTLGYYLICDHTVTDLEATIACRLLGYMWGKHICCSAFGDVPMSAIRVKDVKCGPNTQDVYQCKYTVIGSGYECPTRSYASAACFDKVPPSDLTISIHNPKVPIWGTQSGPVSVKYLGIDGYICPSTWTDKEAAVVCRQLNFAGGQAYLDRAYAGAYSRRPYWIGDVKCNGNENGIQNCKMNGRVKGVGCPMRKYSMGGMYTVAGVVCWSANTAPPKFQLVGGSSRRSGVLQVDFSGVKGTVCRLYSNYEAGAICRKLGFTDGKLYKLSYKVSAKFFIGNLTCPANASYSDCIQSAWGAPAFRCYTMGVSCFAAVRLVNGPGDHFGALQQRKGATTYNFCDEGFDDTAARIVCKELGYVDGKKICCSPFGNNYTTNNYQYLNNVECKETYKSFSQCKSDKKHCASGHYATVYCVKSTIDATKATKYIFSSDYKLGYSGSVNVRFKGVIGRVCAKGWTDMEASVFCKQIGYKTGFAYTQNLINPLPAMVSDVTCANADELEDCTVTDVVSKKNDDCSMSSPTAGVLCSPDDEKVQYRLNSFDAQGFGVVEIKYGGKWGRVCNLFWSNQDATVFCKGLGKGYISGTIQRNSSKGYSGSPIWFSDTKCDGNEKTFLMCPSSGWLQKLSYYCKNPWYSNLAKAKCYGKVRLDRDMTGKVLVAADGATYGTICANGWGQKETDVTCKELGYLGGFTLCCGSLGNNYMLPANLTEFKCTGNEKSLLDCPFKRATMVETRSCIYKNYAAVSCYQREKPNDYLLKLDSSGKTGSVLVRFNKIYGRICPDDWDDKDARVACRELGFRDGSAYTHYQSYSFNKPYWTSNVKCIGSETSLRNCQRTAFGEVTSCKSTHAAGVLCFRQSGVTTTLTGSPNYDSGTVEIQVDGTWGTLCNSYFDDRDARVVCTAQNFADGQALYKSPFRRSGQAKAVWFNRLYCFGNETDLDACPHSSWKNATSWSCRKHYSDVGVVCYRHVRLIQKRWPVSAKKTDGGAIEVFAANSTTGSKRWYPVCDKGFTDTIARKVCIELGFVDGRALLGSAYGYMYWNVTTRPSASLENCDSYKLVKDCMKLVDECDNGGYASAFCFTKVAPTTPSYKFYIQAPNNGYGRMMVKVFGREGRVCSEGWDDTDATVHCKMLGYPMGIASLQHSMDVTYGAKRYPYLVSDLSCKGNEPSLDKCTFNNASAMNANCSQYDAGVLCYRDAGIKYRLIAPPKNRPRYSGRVEISIGSVWGTVCSTLWDKKEAAVFCRSQGYNDGDPVPAFARGTGRVWLTHLQCKGDETSLHRCPHKGFTSPYSNTVSYYCQRHYADAGVVCYKNVRLSRPKTKQGNYKSTMYGTIEVYGKKRNRRATGSVMAWGGICSDDFDQMAAKVVCSELGYPDGLPVHKSAFGNVSSSIIINGVSCSGNEKSILDCKILSTASCPSGDYAGAYCTNETITDTGLQVKLIYNTTSDSLVLGAIQATLKSISGPVCADKWGMSESIVACKTFGKAGGVPNYRYTSNQPKRISDVRCTAGATDLTKCKYTPWGDNSACSVQSLEVGLICYKTNYELRISNSDAGSSNPSSGRVIIKFDNVWGTVCDQGFYHANARAVCREKNFVDGLAKTSSGIGHGKVWFQSTTCKGTENSLMECMKNGFNYKSYFPSNSYCGSHKNDASVECYNEKIVVDKVRLASGNTTVGRVEVYSKTVGKWGTVCVLGNDNEAANVFCRMLGFPLGGRRAYPSLPGTGDILVDALNCNGKETHINDCKRDQGQRYYYSKCQHRMDLTVQCTVLPPSTTPTSPTTTTTTATTPTATTPKTTSTPPTATTPTTTRPVVTQGQRRKMSPGLIAGIIVPLIIIVIILVVVAVIIMHRRKRAQAARGTDCQMQVSNVIYGATLGPLDGASEAPTTFENPLYDNAGNNPNAPGADDGASGIYATVETPTMTPKADVPTSEKADLVDNMQVPPPAPAKDEASNA